jgi:hypothetical protein
MGFNSGLKGLKKLDVFVRAMSVCDIKIAAGCHAYLVQTDYTNMTAARIYIYL